VRFWDTSALVPLLLREPLTVEARAWFEADPGITVWWSTPIECVSALARAERDGRLRPAEVSDAVAALRLLRSGWSEVDATSRLRDIAERLVRTHPLRSADACQLAAAILAAEGAPASVPFVTLDGRLADAASREGFEVIGVARA
jgi:uncharacterized protein